MDRQITMPWVHFKTYFCSMLSAKKGKIVMITIIVILSYNFRFLLNFVNVFLISFYNTCNYSNGSHL